MTVSKLVSATNYWVFLNRVREVLPESAPVTMQTPGLHPKLTMSWSSFCSSGWFQTQNPLASASGVLRLQVHTIMETVSLPSISDLGAYPLAPLPHTIVWEPPPRPVSMAIPSVSFWGTYNFGAWVCQEENPEHASLISSIPSSPRTHC